MFRQLGTKPGKNNNSLIHREQVRMCYIEVTGCAAGCGLYDLNKGLSALYSISTRAREREKERRGGGGNKENCCSTWTELMFFAASLQSTFL